MPYITRDESQNISIVHSTESFSDEEFSVSSVQYEGQIVTLTLSSPQTMVAEKLTTIMVSGANIVKYLGHDRDIYNGKFTVTKISDTQFSYPVLFAGAPIPTGNIKVRFALEYLADDHKDIIDLNVRFSDINSLKQKIEELSQNDYKVIRHYEEICANVAEIDRTMTQQEFEAFHSGRDILRNDISVLEEKFKIPEEDPEQ